MKPLRMHHVGIILPSIEAAQDVMNNLGLEEDFQKWVEVYSATVIFTKYGQWESPIEFIIPKGGVLAEFNGGKGGIAHVCFEVDDIDKVSAEMEGKGIKMLEKGHSEATKEFWANFTRPKYMQGLLFEFIQTADPAYKAGARPNHKN
jgi:lactoylglutathione lyase/methylmalonyl-CoA/ethylmalonyl-CoA epimerase